MTNIMPTIYRHLISYEKVRVSGQYNMLMQASQAAKEAKISLKDYGEILKRYTFLKANFEKEYGSLEEFIKEK